jgi:phage protein D
MIPEFNILANQKNITGLIRDRLIRITTTDEAGTKSDTVDIVLDDRDGKMKIPPTGAELSVYFGFKGKGMFPIGLYVVDEIVHEGPPDTLIIPAKAADMKKSLKVQKSRSWDNASYDVIVRTIAAEHDLEPKVSPGLSSFVFPHVDQTNESDLHFLTRLAKQHDAIVKPVMGNLVLVPRGEAKSVSGQSLETVSLTRGDLSDQNGWRYQAADRGKYDSVKAFWQNKDTSQRVEEVVGSEGRAFTLRHTYPNAQEARSAAKAKLDALSRGEATLELSTAIGMPNVRAEGKIILSGVRDKIDGEWSVTRVEHTFDTSGFKTRIEAETPKK